MGSGTLKYVLDTHVLCWWLTARKRLTQAHRRVLVRAEQRSERVAVSSLSLWEIALLASRGRLEIDGTVDEFLDDIETSPRLTVLGLTARIAADSTRLGAAFPSDPADRMIAATARCHGLTLLTVDERIIDSGAVTTLA